MSNCLKIGHRRLNGDQIISALFQYKLFETLVGQVILDEVLKEVPLSQEELFQILVKDKDTSLPENLEEFIGQWCQQQGITLEYLHSVIVRQYRVQKFKQMQFADRVESEFLRIKPELDQVEFSLLRLVDLALAQELYFQLRDDGKDFANLAHQYSEGSERQTSGRIGPVPVASLPPEITALFQNNPQLGMIYGPVPIEDRFWIVKLDQYIAARLNQSTRTDLINRMYSEWLQIQVKQVIGTPGMIAVQPDEDLINDPV
jgi:parvulin-like peptidyl-prolyl isomerase